MMDMDEGLDILGVFVGLAIGQIIVVVIQILVEIYGG